MSKVLRHGGAGASEVPPTGHRPAALVIGGGVSGCACATGLAARGISVTVVSSALDAIGLPGFGPDVIAGAGGWERVRETLRSLPVALREVWLDSSAAPAGGDRFFVVDRRMLSVETKRALECLPGLRFRQGLVVGVRMVASSSSEERPRVVVDTAFGEEIEGDVAVIAVGLSLGGHVVVGGDVLPGGRYGEAPSDGLRASLEDLGFEFDEASVEVGPRLARACLEAHSGSDRTIAAERAVGNSPTEEMVGTVSLRDVLVGRYGSSVWELTGSPEGGSTSCWDETRPERQDATRLDRQNATREGTGVGVCPPLGWGEGWPEAPHLSPGLRLEQMVVRRGHGDGYSPLLSPDGLATGEVYATPGGSGIAGELWRSAPLTADKDGGAQTIASRLEHRVRGLVVKTVTDDGAVRTSQVGAGFLWVAGRAGGASDYLESLASGTRVAADIARSLRREISSR
ncbi:MAG: FAD-dependent oxidoreductase [Thermoleophilia bacterium]|nr:FAD-dependent oxidoreductase [Thermoleophilia bacterium]